MPSEVPSGWRAAKLHQVADICAGINKPKSAMGRGHLYVTVQDLYAGTSIPVEALGRIQVTDKEAQTRLLKPGDIVFGKSSVKRSGIGYPSQFLDSAEPVIFSGFTYRARAKENIADPLYLFQALRWSRTRSWLVANAQASALTNINQGIADAIPVPLPPLPEQKKIAAILSSVDEAIQAKRAVIEQTRRVKEGLLQDLLTRGIGHTQFQQTEIGEIPEGWEVRRLDQISSSLSVGLVINPSTYFADDGTVPMLVGSNIKASGINWASVRRISASSNETLSTTRIYAGDLVTVRVGNPGLTMVVPPELDGSNCASVMIVRKHEGFDSHWLCSAMNSQQGKRQFRAVQYGTAQKQFNISHAIGFRFAVPPLPEQRQIATILSSINAQARAHEEALAQLRRTKAGLLQDLLTGKVRVTV